jgi:glycine dehydrogenase
MLERKTRVARKIFPPTDEFIRRHIGPREQEIAEMLEAIGRRSLDELSSAVLPAGIQLEHALALGRPRGEHELLAELREMAGRNEIYRSFIGMGYHDCITPPVIQRNILEDPGWYTQYTPYQAEIAQGRLEALLNFQTMVADLTALPLANASLLDEPTAAAEAMVMCHAITRKKKHGFFVSADCHPQTIAVLVTRAQPMGIRIHVGDPDQADFDGQDLFGILVQYPSTDGVVRDHEPLAQAARKAGALTVAAADLLALTLLRAPGEFGADIAVGSTQRFGVPLGFGGPHAAYLATREEYRRQVPGRIVGVSRDDRGKPALRLAMQTREQHIRRDKATSNICTSQVLLAVMVSMYAVYHGPEGLARIARRVHGLTSLLAAGLRRLGRDVGGEPFFDTLRVRPDGALSADELLSRARERGINLRAYDDGSVGVALDETVTADEVQTLLEVFAGSHALPFELEDLEYEIDYDAPFARTSAYLTHEVFHRYHAEHEMLRYMQRLRGRDLSLAQAMIPLTGPR